MSKYINPFADAGFKKNFGVVGCPLCGQNWKSAPMGKAKSYKIEPKSNNNNHIR